MKTALISLYLRLWCLGCIFSTTAAPGNCNLKDSLNNKTTLAVKIQKEKKTDESKEAYLLYRSPVLF